MATIPTNIDERIFNISNWHGVNEAPEGQSRLKFGEAAVMRNFCITSGGALKKRAGSRNVAGFLNNYTPRVREGSRKLLFTETGVGPGHELYPRMVADEVGSVRCAGAPVTVDGSDAAEHRGYFLERDGQCWSLDAIERTGVPGGVPITGGSAVLGSMVVFATGTVGENLAGPTYSGTRYIDTWPVAEMEGEHAVKVTGQSVRRGAPTRRSVGWENQNVGGYFMSEGRLWRYYGVRVDSVRESVAWNKYRCTEIVNRETYYTESEWRFTESSISDAGYGHGAYASYSFDRSTGQFSPSGEAKTVYDGETGDIYSGGGGSMTKISFTAVGPKASRRDEYVKTAQGPYTNVTTRYERGGSMGQVLAQIGSRPDAALGYTYAGEFNEDGVTYTMMRSGGELYCYVRDASDKAYYDVSYSFYVEPMTVTADVYRWYFNETYAETADLTDSVVRGIWSGFVAGREVLCAACGGFLWELSEEAGVWTRTPAGEMDTTEDVHMFGFDEKLYILNGKRYLVWDGERLDDVEGYRPLVSVSVEPTGGGTLLEGVNRLTAGRRCWFSPDGEATVFQLPERDIASVDWARVPGTDSPAGSFTADLEAGTVTFTAPPPRGINSIEIGWSVREDMRGQVCAMRFAELYNGAQDTRVFLYGDGSNRAIYSGLDSDGRPRADYFPDLYEVAVGDANTPVTAMIRHYDRLLAFKLDSAWSIGYDTLTLLDGTMTAGFYVAPVNRSIGNCAYGQAQLVQNRPRTLDGRSVIEWRATGTSGITGDQRNAERVSQRVDASIRQFDLTKARTFYDKFSHEYYVIGEDGTAIVQNLDIDAWYVYTGLAVTCMINYRDELYYGTRDGYLRHFSDRYFSDNGEAIDAYWESGAMSFSEDYRRKYSAMIWVGIKPEDNGYLEVTAQTDRKSDFAVYDVEAPDAGAVPEMERIKIKAKKFTYYKLILRNNTADRTATVVSADMRVRGTGFVR